MFLSVGTSYEAGASQGSNASVPEEDHPDLYIPEEVKQFLPYFHKQIKNRVGFLLSVICMCVVILRLYMKFLISMRMNLIVSQIVTLKNFHGLRQKESLLL